jgi:hypothetical protein
MSRTGSFLTTVSIATTLWARYIIPDLTLDNLNMLLKQLKTGTGVIVVVNVSQTTLIISRSIIQRVEEVIRSGSKPGEISYRFVPIWAVDGSS